MQFDFSSDELILVLVSIVRAVDPRMLRQVWPELCFGTAPATSSDE